MKRIILIDGNSLMFRAYYATAYTGNLMQASSGLYTNAIYGFVNMMTKVVESEEFDYIFVAFDKGKKTFRHQAYQEYKGTRKPMPEEFAMQIPLIKEYLDVMQIKRLETDDYEADDLIATMSTLAKQNGCDGLVISGDKDLLQLVDEHTTVALTKKGITDLEYYTEENFKTLTGFLPTQLIDYKGLIGDSSDNLPGVSGVGPKTATKLLDQYQTLEKIMENVDQIKGKVGEMLRQDKEISLRTKKLATLCRNAKIDVEFEMTKYQRPNVDALRLFFEKVEFKSFIKRLDTMHFKELEIEPDEKEGEKRLVHFHVNELDAFQTYLKEQGEKISKVAIEVELDKINYHKADLLGFGFLIEEEGFYFDKQYIYENSIHDFLERKTISFSSIDIKRVYCTLMKYGIEIKKFDFDVNLAAYVINPSLPNQDSKYLFEEFITTTLPYFEEVYGKKTILSIPDTSVLASYTLNKCVAILEVEKPMKEKLEEANQNSLFYDIELPLALVLAKIELTGFKINPTRLKEIGEFLNDEIERLQTQIYTLVGREFNIGSPKQLGIVLFDELNLGKGKKNKTGYSTSAEILEKLASEHEVPRLVLDYRKYSKLLSTYVVGLMQEMSGVDGKVHTTFKQALTATGRLSSTEPNIQNIPIRTEDGRLIRSAFVPSYEDGYIVSADYSQIELRILADVSNCPAMIDDFNHGKDFHQTTAAKIYDEPLENVNKDMRRIAKAVNFGIIYGMSDWGLSEQLHISPVSANNFIRRYFEVYPEIKTYLDDTIEKAKALGYTKTIFQRRRYMSEIHSTNHALREFAKRTAMNAPIQGAAADIIKIAMIEVQRALETKNLKSKIVAQVHDELILDVPKEELEIVQQLLKEKMENAVQLQVKMIVDVEYGKTWDLK